MKKAFTMIEMLIVLAVIALLTLLTIPNIARYNKTINKTGCKAQVEVVNAAISAYRLETGEEPESIDDLIMEGFLKKEQVVCKTNETIVIEDGQAVLH